MGYFELTGYVLLGLGAPLALLVGVWRKPLLLLFSLSSSFVWLSILIVNSLIWLFFNACGIPNGVSVLVAVGVEEVFRPVYLRGVRQIVSKINRLAESNSMSLITQTEETAIALACGLGHGISHCIALYVNLLTPTLARGTRFYDKCPQISIFFYGAYSTLSMFLLLTSAMVISFNLTNPRASHEKYLVPGLRILSSVVGIFNMVNSACLATLPIQFIVAVAATIIAWRTSIRQPLRPNSN